jgi:carboxylesterase
LIWDFENLLARRLILWAVLCVFIGAGLLLFGSPLRQGAGLTTLTWGVIDILLASTILEKTKTYLGRPSTFNTEGAEAIHLNKILWRSNALDVLYVAAGTALLFFIDAEFPFWRGFGWGVIIQGVFLFAFDLYHVLRIPDPIQMPLLPLFTDPRHAPFTFEGGRPAALLVHGYPGTALEMREIGHALHAEGWTARGLRLPGFGPEIVELIDHNNRDWVDFIKAELAQLKAAGYGPILLVGFSFGGGLALQVAAEETVDGLALVAPLTWQIPPILNPILATARALLPVSIKPFNHIPVQHPMMMEEFFQYLPEIDPADPDQQAELRQIKIPLYILDQLRIVADESFKAAPNVSANTLIIQGAEDPMIRPASTEALARSMTAAQVRREVVNGPHSLTMPHNPALGEVLELLADFGSEIMKKTPQD